MVPIQDQLHLELRKVVPPDSYDEWVKSPNVSLNFESPMDLIKRGDYQPLWTLLYKLTHDC